MKDTVRLCRNGAGSLRAVRKRVAGKKKESLRKLNPAWKSVFAAPSRNEDAVLSATGAYIEEIKKRVLQKPNPAWERAIKAGIAAPSRNEAVISRAMQLYIDEIKREAIQNPELARKKAKMALIRTGVLTPDGKPKKKIVSWE